YPPRRASLRELLHEAQPRAALAGLRGDLELVGDRPDDRDAETAFRELVAVEGRRLVGIEARPVVDDLDAEPVSVQLVGDLDVAVAVRAVGVPHGVGDGFGQREL